MLVGLLLQKNSLGVCRKTRQIMYFGITLGLYVFYTFTGCSCSIYLF